MGAIANAGMDLGSGAMSAFRGEVSAADVISAGLADVEINNAGKELNEGH
jgi:hypothetical protein